MEVTIRARMPDSTFTEISHDEIQRIADALGLVAAIPSRFSSVLVMDLLNLERQDISSRHVLDEIKGLELQNATTTKPSSAFKNPRLSSLWHKHFFAPTFNIIATNIKTELGAKGLNRTVREICSPRKGDILTDEMISELAHAITVAPFQRRMARQNLTGEWLVYSPQPTGNIYLGACPHTTGDEGLIARLKIWELEFPCLSA